MTRHDNHYTVCLLFSEGLDHMLLVRKNRTLFQGMLNGIGGTIEPNEDPYDGALREILEETGLEPSDLRSLGTVRLARLGELSLPTDCKAQDGSGCMLHYYAGAIKDAARQNIRPGDEPLEYKPVSEVMASGTNSHEYAGNGDLPYFTASGLRTLRLFMPEQNRPLPQPPVALKESLAYARGRMDACFRNHSLYQASQEADDVSKLAYAAWYVQTRGLEPGRHE